MYILTSIRFFGPMLTFLLALLNCTASSNEGFEFGVQEKLLS